MGGVQSGNPHSKYTNDQFVMPEQPKQIRSTAFISKFSISFPDSMPPKSRAHHFTVNFPNRDVAVIGYGSNDDSEFFNDIWMIDFANKKWQKLPIDVSSVTPRSGATAVAVDFKIFVFGGLSNSQYLSDLHMIDLQAQTITHLNGQSNATDHGPPGRIGHSMGYSSGKIAIWGGFNGNFLNDLWTYDTSNGTWTKVPCDAHGRADAAFATNDGNLYIIGSSKSDVIHRYNIATNQVELLNPVGNPPPYELKGGMLVSVDRYLILVGGKLENKRYAMIRAYDTVRNWWFILYVAPDGETTTLYDGMIDSNGIFMVPRIYDGSIVYRNRTREIVVMLGKPYMDPPSLNVISIGDALAFFHIQTDMRDMLEFVSL
ncbi:Kelch motif family protein [Tritrichomonas foetus]|uniref:Kelch motif family protein n=1 Tax=Tritrichomonas foetus TaxID=1144522 RepID=A0A1J4JMI5_9EUKA|nr:Kelch motif family protein [Tritrichomonas foetus]|eukprot:OHS98757.1 Kelch motif family protein [Tritrichomonas foetus]